MKIKLRADQLMLVESVLQNIKEDNLVVSPSGSGKSYILEQQSIRNYLLVLGLRDINSRKKNGIRFV